MGSHTAALYVVWVGSFSEPPTMSTRPFLRTATCTGLSGDRYGSVDHCPTTLGCATASAAPAPSAARSTKATRTRRTRIGKRFLLSITRRYLLMVTGAELVWLPVVSVAT